jgi:glycosyltransferase involved in cell wall biosynthesis
MDIEPVRDNQSLEVSLVLPCLNEADTLEACIVKAQRAFLEHSIVGEIVVADNGSTDESVAIAERNGSRVVSVHEKGYGNALMGGIEAARGKFVIMGDADDSYDFLEMPKFVHKLREGYDLVMGCRLTSGGGQVLPNAMPFLHRWWGNPMFSWLARIWFRAPFNDVHCGLRGFTKDFYRELDQRCTGMEFATEMTIKASLGNFKLAEIPITLHPDGRRSHPPHLKTFRDGWRHLRLYLVYTPRWLFLIPGIFLVLLGSLGYLVAVPQMKFGGITFDVNTLLFSSLFILCGYQSIVFAIFTKVFAIMEGLLPEDPKIDRFFEVVNLEKGLVFSAIGLLVGMGFLLAAINEWRLAGFGDLDPRHTMRWVIPGATITALAVQTVFSSFFASVLGLKRK